MSALYKNTFRIFLACGLLCAALACSTARAKEAAPWSYHEKNYEIHTPQLSADNARLIFVRKLHAPDFHEAELFTPEELQASRKQVEVNDRFEDPEVILMDLADKRPRVIDYGWEPVFSPDGKKILYAHQTRPISGLRVLAAALAGNDIREYDIERQSGVTLARPASGHLSFPAYAASGLVVFALSGAVNGAWSGDMGVGAFDPVTGQQKNLYAPVREHNLYHLIWDFAVSGDKCLLLRLRPLTEGTFMAESYAHELVDAESGTVLYDWGAGDSLKVRSIGFRVCPSGPQVYDNGWRAVTPGAPVQNTLGTVPAQGTVQETAQSSGLGWSSPDCGFVAAITDQGLSVHSSNGKPERSWNLKGKGEIQSVSWSPDSSRLVLVISHGVELGEKFAFDEIVVVPLGDMPVAK